MGGPPLGVSRTEFIGVGGEPGELEHLSNQRKRNQLRFPQKASDLGQPASDSSLVSGTVWKVRQ